MISDERERVKQSLKKELGLNRILGCNEVVARLRQQIENISSCDVSVLITGESGTGKELAARAIHYLSGRVHQPFVPVNCGAIPDNLFENELFGHRKGAFTDASFHQDGLVKEAEGGTLFLDEVGVIPSHLQVKLLRLLQDKEYKLLGDSTTRVADIRIIAATNENLPELVKKGIFREDFYYRLNIVSLHIPPLRKRKEDIPVLADYFIKKYSQEYNKSVMPASPEAKDLLMANHWPGNVRELENKIQQAVVMSKDGILLPRDLLFSRDDTETEPKSQTGNNNICKEPFSQAKKKIIHSFEREYLTRLLVQFNGDMVRAAARAGKSRTALWNLMAKHHLHPSQFYRTINNKL
jgi:transcriptional regulator with PAS, ATPase and Fis domain